MDAAAYLQARIDACRPLRPWHAGPLEEMQAWQTDVRARLRALVGVPPWSSELGPWRGSAEVRSGHTLHPVRWNAAEGMVASGYLLEPDRPNGHAAVCIPGHGKGARAIVGLVEEPYQADFALQCVALGFRTLVVEPFGFGLRRTDDGPDDGGTSCHRDSTAALMLGETMTGWRVAEAMSAISLLQATGAAKSVSTIGISGGGLVSLFTGALDPRVDTTVVSGYFNTWRDSVLSVHHCVDNFIPGLLRLMEMPDMAALIASRRLFVESGRQDDIFPIEAFRRAVQHARSVYRAFGVSDRFGVEEFDGPHAFHGVGALRFLTATTG